MEIVVLSKHIAVDVSSAFDVTGREHLVVVAKASWQIPGPGQRPRPIAPQPIAMADIFAGEPGESALLYGADLARFKPRCDVLFNASAHAPEGEPVSELTAAWQVGDLRKGLRVHGPRTWRKRLGMFSPGPAEPFVSMPLHFGLAFGGTRLRTQGEDGEDALSEAQLANPSGIGWYGGVAGEQAEGQPAPSLEALDDPVRKPSGKQMPIAFSAIARHWQPRPTFAGTYDDDWQRDVFPFLPDDFDEQFNQCAPSDQQMPYPAGGEQVVLCNMVKGRPDVRFRLPKLDTLQVRVLRSDYTSDGPACPADTIYFEPDEERFSVVWRASVPIRRHIEEISTVAVGAVSAQWWQQRSMGGDDCPGCGSAEEAA